MAGLDIGATLEGVVSAAMIVSDWAICMEEIPGGHRLTARRGSEVQSMDIMDGAVGSYPGEHNAGKLLYIGPDGEIVPLALGNGLGIVDGVLTIVDKNIATSICGEAICGEAICGEE